MDEPALRRRYALALGAGCMGTFEYDPTTGEVEWDDAFEQLVGMSPTDRVRTLADFAERVHPDDLAETMERASACAEGRVGAYQHEYRMLRADGSMLWVRSNVVPVTQPDGRNRLVGVCADVTDRRQAEEAQAAAREAESEARATAQISHRRLDLLAQVASLLDMPPDLTSTLQRVAELAIDVLADWCVVDLVDEGGQQRAAIAHRDPTFLRLAEEVDRRWPSRTDDPARLAVMQSREPLHIPVVEDEMLVGSARDQEHLQMLRRFSMSSAAVVPVQAGGVALGVLTLIGTDGREITPEDVELTVELGRHAGAAVERARVQGERERVATALQRTLLPPALPTVPGVDLAAAYEPAGTGAAVGGDFYDVVTTGRNRWWVALGDVQGKGPEAAAVTGIVRHTLRAVVHETDDPADALRRTQAALQYQSLDERTASVVLLTFVAGEVDLAVSVASAGHPAPLIRAAAAASDATGVVREVVGSGLLFGVGAPVAASTAVVHLMPGEVLLLYTDGATDAPVAGGGRLGDAGLRDLVASAAPKPSAVVDAVITPIRRTQDARRDDIALLALGPTPR